MKKQKKVFEVYKFIKKFIKKNKYSPSVREIAKGVGLSSTCSVQFHLSNLKEYGVITHNKGQNRTIRVLNKHWKGVK